MFWEILSLSDCGSVSSVVSPHSSEQEERAARMALTHFEAIMISVLALLSFSVTNFNFSLYHLFMWKDKGKMLKKKSKYEQTVVIVKYISWLLIYFLHFAQERSCRLLNVFYGYIAFGLQAGSVMCLASLFRDKIFHLEIEYFTAIWSNFYISRLRNTFFLTIILENSHLDSTFKTFVSYWSESSTFSTTSCPPLTWSSASSWQTSGSSQCWSPSPSLWMEGCPSTARPRGSVLSWSPNIWPSLPSSLPSSWKGLSSSTPYWGETSTTLNLFSHFISFLITSDNCFIAKLDKVFQKNQWNRSKLEKNCILEM